MRSLRFFPLLLIAVACGSSSGSVADGGSDEAAVDASPVPPDAAPDASVDRCASAPGVYADLCAQLETDLDDYQNAIAALGPGANAPFLYAGQLTAANANDGPDLLGAGAMPLIGDELDFLAAMGMTAVSVEVSFPMLDKPFLMQVGADYDSWASFYKGVADAIRAHGMKVIVESQSMIPSGLQSTWATPLMNFYGSYAGNFSGYVAERASAAVNVATTMQPDWFVLQEEPDTEASQAGQPAALGVEGSTTMLNATLAAVRGAGTNAKLGAGFGAWLGTFQSFANSFTRTACGPNQPCVNAPLDFLDMHVFPLLEHAGACPSAPCSAGNFWQNTLGVVATAEKAGIPMTVSQSWLRKARDTEWPPKGGLGDVQEAREAYSFWAPLDQRALQALHDLARHQGMSWVAPFNTQSWAAYIDWSEATSIQNDCGPLPAPCGSLMPSDVFGQVEMKANDVFRSKTNALSSTGQFWSDLIKSGQ